LEKENEEVANSIWREIMEEVQGEPIQEIGNDIDISNYEYEYEDKSKESFSSLNLSKEFQSLSSLAKMCEL
jgi:hypothetical protein